MIVNPAPPGGDPSEGAKVMMGFYADPYGLGHYAEPIDDLGMWAEPEEDFGYFAEDYDDGYGDYAEEPEMVGWGAPMEFAEGYDGIGYAEPPDFGEVYEADDLGWYGEEEYFGEDDYLGEDDFGEEEEYGWFAEDDDFGWYGEDEDLYGMGDDLDFGDYAEDDLYGDDEYGWFAEEEQYEPLAGYVRDAAPAFNPAVVAATGLGGYGEFAEDGGFAGYVKPGTVNATCAKFAPQPGKGPPMPDTLRPLW